VHLDAMNVYPDILKSTQIDHILLGFNSYKHCIFLAIEFFLLAICLRDTKLQILQDPSNSVEATVQLATRNPVEFDL
jgi:hypothetical protein